MELSAARPKGTELLVVLVSMCRGREAEDKDEVWFPSDKGGAVAELAGTDIDVAWSDLWRVVT